MPTQKVKRTKTGNQEDCARLSRLEEMDILIGSIHHPSPEPARLAVKQIDQNSARIYELPSGLVAVVVPATIQILVSGIFFTDVAVFIPRFDCQLELSDPGEYEYYPDLINEFRHNTPTKLLNNLLTSEIPLRPCQRQGVIVADGSAFVPHEFPDELPVTMELLLTDERCNEFCFKFEVRLDRILKLKYERRQLERRERMLSTQRSGPHGPARTGIFGPNRVQVGNPKSGSPKEAINRREPSGEDDGGLRKPHRVQVENPKRVSPKEAIHRREASGEDDRGLRKPNRVQVGNPKSGSPKKAINRREPSGEDDRGLRKPR
jgi:hypothetical protein